MNITGVKAWWGLKYDEHKPIWPSLWDVDSSDKNYEEMVEGTGFGLVPVKTEGQAVQYDSETQGVTTRFTHVVYGMGWICTREELEDNLYDAVAKRRTERLAFSLRMTDETVHANRLNRAFNPAYLGADGVELCSTSHPTLSGNQSNELATPADLSEASLEDMCIQIMNARNSRGIRVQLTPQKLAVNPANFFTARRIIESELQNDTGNNAKNIVGDMFRGGLVNWTFLDDPDAWFVKTDALHGLTHYWRRKPEFTKDNDFDTENAKAKVTSRWSEGYGDWRTIYGSPGS